MTHLVDLAVSFLQSLVLLLVQFGDDGGDLCLVTQNNSSLLRQIVVLHTHTQKHYHY